LDYTPDCSSHESGEESKYWLASGSRDRLTQLFEVKDNKYEMIAIIEDHSGTITSLKFAEEKGHNSQKRIILITCGADKSIV
jgi:WD40 repeat protein